MIKYLRVLMPDFWIMNNPYSKHWDKKLNELLDKHKFTEITKYTAKLGETTVWIENHPYSSFKPYGDKQMRVRPSRMTILNARERLMEDAMELFK